MIAQIRIAIGLQSLDDITYEVDFVYESDNWEAFGHAIEQAISTLEHTTQFKKAG